MKCPVCNLEMKKAVETMPYPNGETHFACSEFRHFEYSKLKDGFIYQYFLFSQEKYGTKFKGGCYSGGIKKYSVLDDETIDKFYPLREGNLKEDLDKAMSKARKLINFK